MIPCSSLRGREERKERRPPHGGRCLSLSNKKGGPASDSQRVAPRTLVLMAAVVFGDHARRRARPCYFSTKRPAGRAGLSAVASPDAPQARRHYGQHHDREQLSDSPTGHTDTLRRCGSLWLSTRCSHLPPGVGTSFPGPVGLPTACPPDRRVPVSL
jgi:hypothetical protein